MGNNAISNWIRHDNSNAVRWMWSGNNLPMKGAQWFVASTLVLMGAYLLVFGNVWAPSVFKLLSGSTFGAWMELIVPLLPMAFIGAGAAFIPFHRR